MVQKQFLLVMIVFFTCMTMSSQVTGDEIVNKAIEKAGGDKFDNSIIHFTFRGKQYRSERNKGMYALERYMEKPEGMIHDIVSNSGLKRSIDNCIYTVADSLQTKISDGVNSVHYFANLPYGLQAEAVHKKLIGESSINGKSYYKIKVTFDKIGGGTDFEDEFMYWIHKDDFTVDYLAYKYAVNGGGIRFRAAYHIRTINGIRFVDYINYKISDLSVSLSELDNLFEKNKLKQVSKIELTNIAVYRQ